MPASHVIQPSLQEVFARHRIYQLHHGAQPTPLRSLTDLAAHTLAQLPSDALADAPLHLLPDHLREHVAHYTPDTALTRPIRDVVGAGLPPWPHALQMRHAAIYVAGVCGHPSELGLDVHPDAQLIQGWEGELLRPLRPGAGPAALLAQIDLGRLLLGTTTREYTRKNKVWRRVLRFANTRHGPLAPPPQPTRVEFEYGYRSEMVLLSLKELWAQLVDEYLQADKTFARKALPPYTAALCQGAALAPHWDYDLLRLSVTDHIDGTARRTPSRSLRTLRQALHHAAQHAETTQAAKNDLVQLNLYLGIFEAPRTHRDEAQIKWLDAGLNCPFDALSESVRQARATLSSPQVRLLDASDNTSYTAARALIGLWTESVHLRSPTPLPEKSAGPHRRLAPVRKYFERSEQSVSARPTR